MLSKSFNELEFEGRLLESFKSASLTKLTLPIRCSLSFTTLGFKYRAVQMPKGICMISKTMRIEYAPFLVY